MSKFTTNRAIHNSMRFNQKQTTIDEQVILSKEIQKKIQLIKKTFR